MNNAVYIVDLIYYNNNNTANFYVFFTVVLLTPIRKNAYLFKRFLADSLDVINPDKLRS